MFWTNFWTALTALGTLALAYVTYRVTRREVRREQEERRPFVRADAVRQDDQAGSGVQIATVWCTIEPEVRLVNLGRYPIHVEAAMWWSDRMLEGNGVLPKTQRLSLTIPPGANIVARPKVLLTISEWGWLRFYFRNGATSSEYPYLEVPMYLHKYIDESTYGYDDQLVSIVLFNFEMQKQDISTMPWHEVRHTFRADDGSSLHNDQFAYAEYFNN